MLRYAHYKGHYEGETKMGKKQNESDTLEESSSKFSSTAAAFQDFSDSIGAPGEAALCKAAQLREDNHSFQSLALHMPPVWGLREPLPTAFSTFNSKIYIYRIKKE